MDQSLYIVRDTVFGQEFGPKLVAALLGLVLVAWDRATQRRWDYLWVFVTGTVVWGGAEYAIQRRGIREMPSHLLLGHELPPVVAQLIQGAAEGATMAVMGVFVADRWLTRGHRVRAFIAFVVFGAALALSSWRATGVHGQQVGSRREVFNTASLLFIALLLAISLGAAWRHPWCRTRLVAMFVAIVGLGAVWTVAQVIAGGRWVEVGSESAGGPLQHAGPALTAAILGFDVVFEIAVVYLPFLAIPILLRLIRERPDGSNVGSVGSHTSGPAT